MDDEEIAIWVDQNGISKSSDEVKAWSKEVEAYRPYDDPDKRDWFIGECKPLSLDPAKTTLFDDLEADDRASFAK